MSTRAVYTFVKKSKYGLRDIHVYKHHDGYPQGGVEWIRNAINPMNTFDEEGDINTRDTLVCNFLNHNRENGFMEITSNWKDHGDLEYRYEIFEDFTIKIFKISNEKDSSIFEGSIAHAVHKYCKKGEVLSNG